MVGTLIGLALSGIAGLIDALTKYITTPWPIKVHDEQGNEKFISIIFTKPHKVEKQRLIGMILFGDISDALLKSVEADFIAGLVVGHHNVLLDDKKKKIDKGKCEVREVKYADYQFKFNEVKEFGQIVANTIYSSKDIRSDLKWVSKSAGIRWDTSDDKSVVKALVDWTYSGDYVIKYWEKGLLGESEYVIPIDAVKFWGKIYPFTGEEPSKIAKELYDAKLLKEQDSSRENRRRYNDSIKAIKEYIKAQKKK